MQPTNLTPDLSAVQPVLDATGQAVGSVQGGLAEIAGAAVAQAQSAVKSLKGTLGKIGSRAVAHQTNLAGAIQAQLGEIAQAAVQPGMAAAQQIGVAVATGQGPPPQSPTVLPSVNPPPATGQIGIGPGAYLPPGTPGGITEAGGPPQAGEITPFTAAAPPGAPPFSGSETAPQPVAPTAPQQAPAGETLPPVVPPPVQESPGTCSFIVPPLAAPLSDYCGRWKQIVDTVVAAGYQIMKDISDTSKGSRLNTDWIKSLAKCMTYDISIDPEIFGWAAYVGSCEATCDLLDWWIRTLSTYVCATALDMRAALAVKAALTTIASVEIDNSVSEDQKRNLHFSAKPEILGVGYGLVGDQGAGVGNAIKASTRLFIVPIIELVDRVVKWLCPAEIPSAADVIGAYLHNWYSDDAAACLLQLNGFSWEMIRPIIMSRAELITPEEHIQWGRRIGNDDQAIADGLRRYGFLTPHERAAKVGVYDQLPSVTDVLHFLQRNVFDGQYVSDYGLLDGFNERFWPRYGDGLRALGVTFQTASDHYAAHWINPSVGQLAEMVMRLRPGRVPANIQFTTNDFLRVLAEQDVAPYFRQRLLATAYRVLPLRQLNQATQQGRFDRNELIQRWQDIGFSPQDAATMADTSIVSALRQVASAGHGYTAALVSDLAGHSLIDKAKANNLLGPQGFSPAQVDELFDAAKDKFHISLVKKHQDGAVNDYAKTALKAYSEGAVNRDTARVALLNSGYTDLAADLELQNADLRVQMETITAAVKQIRRAFMYGEVDAQTGINLLSAAGVQTPMAMTYMQRWQLERSVPRVAVSSAAVIRWARKGVISVQNAGIRLVNLGFSPEAAQLELLEIEQDIMLAGQKAGARRAKELAQAQAAAQRAVKATQRQFCKLYTPGRMIRWYALRIINEGEFNARITQCGYTADERDKLFKQAEVAREAADEKAAKKGPAGVEYTGPGADTSVTAGG